MSERRIYIGAPVRCEGWEAYDAVPHRDADYSGPLDRMEGIPDGAYSIVYANVLNRLDLETEALRAMCEWRRILRPGGALIAVCLDPVAMAAGMSAEAPLEDQVLLMRLFAQRSHWTAEPLSVFLQVAGFRNVRRAERPGLFNDVSELAVGGRRIGLSVLAEAY